MAKSVTQIAAQWADERRFGPSVPFGDVRTSALPLKEPRVSGLYLLEFANGTYYVGESVDLRSRMSGHRSAWGSEIASVRIRRWAASKQDLRRYERVLTHELEAVHVPIRNVLNASITSGVNALDELVDEPSQRAWLADPAVYNGRDRTPLKELTAQSVQYSTAAQRFREHPRCDDATSVLRRFLERCVPVPRVTEFQYWSVSTGTYRSSQFPRVFCVSVGKMEVCVVSADKAHAGQLAGFVTVRASVLDGRVSTRKFARRHPGVVRRPPKYLDAGGDAITLVAPSLEAFSALVDDTDVSAAAGALVLDLMRKHFCVYTRYHCPQVVEMVYPEFERSAGSASGTDDVLLKVAESPVALVEAEHGDLPEQIEGIEDFGDVEIFWVVGAGSQKSGRHQPSDFVEHGEWRMDPRADYEGKVADMRPGERIAVRTRRNITEDVPFDNHGHLVSVMDFHLRGVITANPGDGCSVRVSWETPPSSPPRFYLYTSQDPVWPLVRGRGGGTDQLIDFVFEDKPQDVDTLRNAGFWSERFGDRP